MGACFTKHKSRRPPRGPKPAVPCQISLSDETSTPPPQPMKLGTVGQEPEAPPIPRLQLQALRLLEPEYSDDDSPSSAIQVDESLPSSWNVEYDYSAYGHSDWSSPRAGPARRSVGASKGSSLRVGFEGSSSGAGSYGSTPRTGSTRQSSVDDRYRSSLGTSQRCQTSNGNSNASTSRAGRAYQSSGGGGSTNSSPRASSASFGSWPFPSPRSSHQDRDNISCKLHPRAGGSSEGYDGGSSYGSTPRALPTPQSSGVSTGKSIPRGGSGSLISGGTSTSKAHASSLDARTVLSNVQRSLRTLRSV
jgi:hypothetical protein